MREGQTGNCREASPKRRAKRDPRAEQGPVSTAEVTGFTTRRRVVNSEASDWKDAVSLSVAREAQGMEDGRQGTGSGTRRRRTRDQSAIGKEQIRGRSASAAIETVKKVESRDFERRTRARREISMPVSRNDASIHSKATRALFSQGEHTTRVLTIRRLGECVRIRRDLAELTQGEQPTSGPKQSRFLPPKPPLRGLA